MDWSHLQRRIPFESNFRWRGGQVSRVEAFTDAVFALSLTLMVVSTEVPDSFDALVVVLKAMPAFAVSFVLLLMAWYFHFIHFRRYGIEDATTTFLTAALVFVVLFYVYPLKFMFGFLQAWITGGVQQAADAFGLDAARVGQLLIIYGVGFVLMYVVLALMALHALRLREALELNEVEVVMTRSLINTHWIQVAVGCFSVFLAVVLPLQYKGFAGWAYLLLPVAHPIHGRVAGRREREAVQRMRAAATAPEGATAAAENGQAGAGL